MSGARSSDGDDGNLESLDVGAGTGEVSPDAELD